jgi:hypothetical protein
MNYICSKRVILLKIAKTDVLYIPFNSEQIYLLISSIKFKSINCYDFTHFVLHSCEIWSLLMRGKYQ